MRPKTYIILLTNVTVIVSKNKKPEIALAGVSQWTKHWPVNQRVTGSIPSQGTCLGCGPVPQQGACERQPHIDASLPVFLLPSPLSKTK